MYPENSKSAKGWICVILMAISEKWVSNNLLEKEFLDDVYMYITKIGACQSYFKPENLYKMLVQRKGLCWNINFYHRMVEHII